MLIGVSHKGRPLLGVVHVPFRNTLYWGVDGVGTFRVDENGNQSKIEPSSADHNHRRILTSRHYLTQAILEKVNSMNPTEVLSLGGGGRKGLEVLRGRAEAWL